MNIISWTFAYFIFFLSIKFEIILDLQESPKDSARGPVHPSPSFPQCEQFPFCLCLSCQNGLTSIIFPPSFLKYKTTN